MTDLIAVLLIVGLGRLGWRRGTALTALSSGSLIAGYLGALLLYKPVGRLLAGVFSVPPILAFPLGGIVIMVAITVVLRLMANRVKLRRMRLMHDGWLPSVKDHVGGAVLGSLCGIGVAIVLTWGATVVHELTGRGPDVENTVAGHIASIAVGKTIYVLAKQATGDEVLASTISLVAVKPGEAVRTLTRLFSDNKLRAVFESRDLRDAVMRSDVAAITRHPAMLDLARDAFFLEAARSVGLTTDLAGNVTPEAVSEQLAERIAPMVRAVESMSRDVDVQRILQNPQFMERLQAGNLRTLTTDSEFNRLAEKIVESFNKSHLTGSR